MPALGPPITSGHLSIEYQMKYGSEVERIYVSPANFAPTAEWYNISPTPKANIFGLTFYEHGVTLENMDSKPVKLTIKDLGKPENMNLVIQAIRASIDSSIEKSVERMAIERSNGSPSNW